MQVNLEDGQPAVRGMSAPRGGRRNYRLLNPVPPQRLRIFKIVGFSAAGLASLVASFLLGHFFAMRQVGSLSRANVGDQTLELEFSVPTEPDHAEDSGQSEAPPRELMLHLSLPMPVNIKPPWTNRDQHWLNPKARQAVKERYVRFSREVGCYRLSESDNLRKGQNLNFMDTSCVEAKGNTPENPCGSGLPFYRAAMQDRQTHYDCALFCLSKGLDLHGSIVLPESLKAKASVFGDVTWECRCGASYRNKDVWREIGKNRSKMLNPKAKVPKDDPNCEMFVWVYTGPMSKHGAVPFMFQVTNVDDEGYVDSIATGIWKMGAEEDTPVALEEMRMNFRLNENMDLATAQNRRLVEQHQAEARRLGICQDSGALLAEHPCSWWKHACKEESNNGHIVRDMCPATCGECQSGQWPPCFPYKCAEGRPWPKDADGLVYINFYFSGVSEAAKENFRMAVAHYDVDTCIRFVEQSNPKRPAVKVHATPNKCYVNPIGFKGQDQESELNMGGCNTQRHVWNLVHELGHIIGMSHEQKRPDGSTSVNTPDGVKAAKLIVHWQNIHSDWVGQFTPNRLVYIGSNNQGKTQVGVDTFEGWKEYDYGSVMHYGRNSPFSRGNAYSTVNPMWNNDVGQRSGFSDEDLRQIADMYQCKMEIADVLPTGEFTLSNSPTPAPPPTPPTPPSPSSWFRRRRRTSSPKTSSSSCSDKQPPPDWKCNGGQCQCAQLVAFCSHQYYGPDIRRQCPSTCGACGGNGGCTDRAPTGWTCNGRQCSCSSLVGYCNDPMYGATVSSQCRATCGQC